MRWIRKEYREPCANEMRIIKLFAFLPIEINLENRWLETVYIKQRYENKSIFSFSEIWDWVDKEFVTKEEYIKYMEKSIGIL